MPAFLQVLIFLSALWPWWSEGSYVHQREECEVYAVNELSMYSLSLAQVHAQLISGGGPRKSHGLLRGHWHGLSGRQRKAVVALLAGTIALVVLLVLTLSILLLHSKYIGDKVRQGIETHDREYLGVDVSFGNVDVAAFTGTIHIKKMLVLNPPGYKASHLLSVGEVDIVLDTKELACGCFSFDKVTIQHVVIRDVEIILEHSWTSSNVQDLINFLTYGGFSGDLQETPAPQPQPLVQPEPTTSVKGSAQGETDDGEQWLTLHELRIEQSQVKLASHTFEDAGVHLQIADIVYKDLDKELGNYVVDDIIKFVLKSILATAVSHLAAPLAQGGDSKSKKFGCC